VDWEGSRILIRRSLSWARPKGEEGPVRARFYEPKTQAGRRTIPAPPELIAALKRWRLACPRSELDLVFPTPSGAPQHRSNVLRYGLYPALRRAGLRRVGMHSLRHSFASALVASGAPVTEVQALLGHANPSITLRVYSHHFKKCESGALSGLARTLCARSWTLSGHLEPSEGELTLRVEA
jgi:integrase